MGNKNKYWDVMTPEQRSREMAKRRAKATKPAGGLSYLTPEKRAAIMERVRAAKKHETKQTPPDENSPES